MIDDTTVNFGSISRMLTLRYDPANKPVRAPLSAQDFTPRNISDAHSRIIEIIRKSLEQRHRELGFNRATLSLSAGVDSGVTIVALRKFLPGVKLDCISVGFGDADDETERAGEIARIYNCTFRKIILDDILTDLPRLIDIVREPRWNLYHYYALEAAKKNSSVFYAGDGGDELFGGYTFRYSKFLSLLSAGATWRDKVKNYLACHERDWVPDQDKMFGKAVKFSWDTIYRSLKPHFDNALEPLNQVFLADFNGKLLYDWLPTNKAFGESLGMNIESIFLTDEMIEYATHIPWQMKYDPATKAGKMPLRAILAKQKGFENINLVKKGFSADLSSMWARGAREVVGKYVNADSEVVKAGIISSQWVKGVVKNLGRKPDLRYVSKMLSILALEVWYRLYVSGTMRATQKL